MIFECLHKQVTETKKAVGHITITIKRGGHGCTFLVKVTESGNLFCRDWSQSQIAIRCPDGCCGGLNMLGLGSGTIRRHGLVGVGVALLVEVCHCVGGL